MPSLAMTNREMRAGNEEPVFLPANTNCRLGLKTFIYASFYGLLPDLPVTVTAPLQMPVNAVVQRQQHHQMLQEINPCRRKICTHLPIVIYWQYDMI